jgi:glycosyltransferase involved in cell wall biosynthesis
MADSQPEAVLTIRRNAGWLTLSAVAGGGLNFLYALVLTWLLPLSQYPVFAGTQALLVVCGTAAAASAPWMLSQRLARNPSPVLRRDAITFAVALTGAQGLLAALVVGTVASGLARGLGALPLVAAGSAFAIFAAATSTGYLQGRQQFKLLAVLLTGEVVLKVLSSVLLLWAGAGAVGVIAGIGVGALALVAAASPPLLRELRGGLRWFRDRELWGLLLGLTGIQLGVVVLMNLDLVIGSLVSRDTASLAGYQVSVILSRAPFYLASSLSVAVFTRLVSRQTTVKAVMGSTLSILLGVVTPIAVAVATLPLPLAQLFLPHSYQTAVEAFLPYTAPAGALAAFSNLITTFYQAEGRFRAGCVLLAVGIGAEAVGCVAGLRTLGVHGLAYASLGSQILTALLLYATAARFWGRAVLPRPWALLTAPAAAPLFILRPLPAVWLGYAVGLCALVGWLALFRRRRPDGPRLAPATSRPVRTSVYLLTAGPVSPPWDGGDTNLARVLVSAEMGVDFTFLGKHGDPTPLRPGHQRRELRFASGVPTLREQLRIFAWLGRERAEVDLVHLVITFGRSRLKEAALSSLPLLRRHPLVVTCPNGGYLPPGLLARACAVIALSRQTEVRLLEMGLDWVYRIPPGIDFERFRPGPEDAAQRMLGLPPAPSLLFAGHYDPGGGLDCALNVLQRLRQDVPSLRLLTAMRERPGHAGARERARIAVRMNALGLAGSVVELGQNAADIPLALRACRAVLFQPERVGRKMDLPMVLLEALASGRPILVSPADALAELADGSPAVAVEPRHGAGAVEYLRRLLTDRAYAESASLAALQLAQCRYSAEAMVTAYAELYARLLGRDQLPSPSPDVLAEAIG